ncbi:BNR-4 repeat-containing protein [Candidatus Sumerlaeota bacterium]|nr:BNR-4 repeat-containing protein [Candidatus Sumerlaeota bacterium]
MNCPSVRLSVSLALAALSLLSAVGLPAADDVAGDLITFSTNGGWCWYQDERVIVDNGRLLIGSVPANPAIDQENGDIEVVVYDFATSAAARIELHGQLQNDDHAAPAFLVRPDGRYLAMYSKHGSDYYARWRISVNPGDPYTWQDEQAIYMWAGVTYSNLFRLGEENSGAGRTYDFHRSLGWHPNYLYSDDDGSSWTYGARMLYFNRERPYVKYCSNNTDRIHFTTTEAHPRDYGCGIYHGYFMDGKVYASDGTLLSDLSTSGAVWVPDLTTVFNGDWEHNAWTTDMQLDENGDPYAAFTVQINETGSDNRYHYARWDGGQWHVHEMAYAGSCLYDAEDNYTGLAALNPHDPNEVYISTDANPATGDPLISAGDGLRHWEIFRGVTDDGGASWTWHPVTWNSTEDNLRPIIPIWDADHTMLLWLRGTYSTYTSYKQSIVGLFQPQRAFPAALADVVTTPTLTIRK